MVAKCSEPCRASYAESAATLGVLTGRCAEVGETLGPAGVRGYFGALPVTTVSVEISDSGSLTILVAVTLIPFCSW